MTNRIHGQSKTIGEAFLAEAQALAGCPILTTLFVVRVETAVLICHMVYDAI